MKKILLLCLSVSVITLFSQEDSQKRPPRHSLKKYCLIAAVFENDFEAVQRELAYGANPFNIKYSDIRYATRKHTGYGCYESHTILGLIDQSGWRVKKQPLEIYRALTKSRDKEKLKKMLYKDRYVLMGSVLYQPLDYFKQLVEDGYNPYISDAMDRSLLARCIEAEKWDKVDFLVKEKEITLANRDFDSSFLKRSLIAASAHDELRPLCRLIVDQNPGLAIELPVRDVGQVYN